MKASVMLVLVAGCASWTIPASGEPGRKPVGVIVEFQPTVELRTGSEAAPLTLTRSNLFQKLYLGESVRCGGKGVLKVAQLSGKEWEFKSAEWTLVPDADPQANGDERMRLWRLALAEHTKISGRQRATGAIYCPANRSSVRAGGFDAIRWTPAQRSGHVKLLLRDKTSRNVLWRERDIEGASGQFLSIDFIMALQRQRDVHRGELELELTDAEENRSLVNFSTLTAEQEQELQVELGLWDKHFTGVVRHMGRAASLHERKLLNEAAAEYDRAMALEEAKDSIELLRQTIAAHELTGNLLQVQSLQRRLPQPSALPRDR